MVSPKQVVQHPDPRAAPPDSRVAVTSLSHGLGVVTTQAAESGQLLLVFGGPLDRVPGRHTLQVGEEQHLVPPTPTAAWQFINHSCAPSCRVEFGAGPGLVRLVARGPLAPGQEVTFDYLTTEWDLATPFPCSCGAPSCVGLVRGARYLNDARLAALAPELAPHVQTLLRSAGRWPSAHTDNPGEASSP